MTSDVLDVTQTTLGREDPSGGVPVSSIVKKATEPAEVDAMAMGSVIVAPILCEESFDPC